MPSDVIIRPLAIDRDAESLAEMWNESDLQWPGTWTGGVPYTAETMHEWHREGRFTEVYVAEVEGKIVGYCSFMEGNHQLYGEGYLAVLNVHPKYQKRSVGRRLIQATIERSAAEGWPRQTLGTWSANFKAVPTYKKTGHFWTPDTSVWMQNFVPGALRMSLAKPFFQRHDWYDAYVRELRQEPDDERWEGLKVYTQRWEADGDSLTVWVDREARAPVAIETDAVQVAAIAEEIEPLTGSETRLRWRVINKGDAPIRVHVHAVGDKGLTIDHREGFSVEAGETEERVAEVKVAHDASRSKDDGTAPAVRSIVRIDDDEVELYSGMRVRRAVGLDTAPAEVTLCPGVASTIQLQLHNELERPIDSLLYLTPSEGVETSWRHRAVSLPPKGHVSVPVALMGCAEGVHRLAVRAVWPNDRLESVDHTLTVFALDAGGLLANRQGNAVRIETDALRIAVSAKGAKVTVTHRGTRRALAELRPNVGPPYWPGEFDGKEFDLSLETRGGRAVVRLSAETKHFTGLFLHEELTVAATGLCVARCYLENRGSQPQSRQIRLHVFPSSREHETFAVPLPTGIVRGVPTTYPFVFQDAPRDPAHYAEPWLAWEREGAVAGVAWDDGPKQIDVDRRVSFDGQAHCVEPGSRSPDMRVALYAGSGTWDDARRSLTQWAGRLPEQMLSLPVRAPVEACVEPEALLTIGEEVSARLVVDSAANRKTCGRVHLCGEGGLVVDPTMVVVEGLSRGSPVEREVHLSLPGGALGVYRGEVRVDLDRWAGRRSFHVVRPGTDAPVTVTEGEHSGQRLWTIDNGRSVFGIAPGFGPSVISWTHGGENQLESYFPKPQGFSWLYPAFGGLHALLLPGDSHVWEGYLHQEPFAAKPIEARDTSDLVWKGLRLTTRPEKQELHDLRVELEFVTLGEASTLKFVYRLQNLRGTEQTVSIGSRLISALGSDPSALVLRGEGLAHRPTPWGAWPKGQPWGALTNDATGRTLLMMGTRNDVDMDDLGEPGRVLGSSQLVRLAGRETHESVYYVVLADSLEEARAYLVMRTHR